MRELTDNLVAYLSADPNVVAVVLFGSAAAGRLRADSDIDLAVLFVHGHAPDELAVLQLRGELEQIARRDVDLIVLNRASPIIAHQAIRYGQLLFCRDRRAYHQFVVRLITEYADFKRIRRPIEDAVIRRRVL